MSKHKISDFLENYGDGIHGTPNYDENGTVFFINGNNLVNGKIQINANTLKITEEEANKIKRDLNEKTLLLSINGTLGNIALYNHEKIALGKSACFLNVKEEKDKIFLKYVLSTKEFKKYMQLVATGSTIKNLSPSQVANYEFELKDNVDKYKVSNLLSSIDNKIENNNKINAELESLAKTIYDYWFLQFEFPNEEGKPYKSSGGKMVWNEKLKREIPEGWEVIYLKDLFSFVKGKNPSNLSQSKTENCNSPYITIDVANLGEPSFCNPQDMIMCHEDVIMVMDGAASGDIYIGCKGVLGSTFSLLKIKNDIVKKEELYMTLLSLKPIYKKCNKGSTVPHANKEFIEQIAVPFPKKRTFDSKLEQIFKRIFELRHENQNLSSLRDFLLPMLMNGQISFSDDI